MIKNLISLNNKIYVIEWMDVLSRREKVYSILFYTVFAIFVSLL